MENNFIPTYNGCLPAKTDIRDYKLCSANNPSIVYPNSFVLNNLPRIKNQGNVNSCCAHSLSSILEWHAENRQVLSTNFIYGIQKKLFNQCQMGMYLAQACQISMKYGDMCEVDCKGNDEIPKCYSIAEAALENKAARDVAYYFRTINYYLCQKDNDIKAALMNYGPVLGAIMWCEKYYLDENNIIHFDTNSNQGGHATMICGWNDDKKAWLIQNSWGEGFGDRGRFWLPYDYGFCEARAIVDYDNSEDLTLTKPCKKWPEWLTKLINNVLNLFK